MKLSSADDEALASHAELAAPAGGCGDADGARVGGVALAADELAAGESVDRAARGRDRHAEARRPALPMRSGPSRTIVRRASACGEVSSAPGSSPRPRAPPHDLGAQADDPLGQPVDVLASHRALAGNGCLERLAELRVGQREHRARRRCRRSRGRTRTPDGARPRARSELAVPVEVEPSREATTAPISVTPIADADPARELRGRGRSAHHLPGRGVLHDDDERLHHEADTDAEDRDVADDVDRRRVGAHGREQGEADRHERRPDEQDRSGAAGARDDLTGDHARPDPGEHQRA